MKIKRLLPTAVVVSLLMGCATTFKPWKLSDVQEGMDRDQVVKILGAPDHSVEKDGAEYLYYSYREELAPAPDVSLETAEGIDRRVEEFNRTLEDVKYEVVIVEGKLVNYKELRD